MGAFRFKLQGQSEVIVGTSEGEVIDGGKGKDILVGLDGADTYVFHKGDGADYVIGFQTGVDKLEVHSSPRQISHKDTDQGLEIYYGEFGQEGKDHFLLVGVHTWNPNDFILS